MVGRERVDHAAGPSPTCVCWRPRNGCSEGRGELATTHGAESAVDCCRYLAGLIAAAVVGVPKEELLSSRYEPTSGLCHDAPLDPAVDEVAAGSFKHREPPEIHGSGYVVRSLEAALWALHRSSMFRDGALLAVNLGEDADTTGAVYGQLAGAIYGANQIPAEWRERRAMRELLERRADELFALATQGPALNPRGVKVPRDQTPLRDAAPRFRFRALARRRTPGLGRQQRTPRDLLEHASRA